MNESSLNKTKIIKQRPNCIISHEINLRKRKEILRENCEIFFDEIKNKFCNLSNEKYQNREKIVCHLEIGCGHGDFLTNHAIQNENICCIGIDLISKRLKCCLRKKELHNLSNMFFLKAEATEFLSEIPKEIKFEKVFLLYPDPWPKKRHHKYRLIQKQFLDSLETRMQTNGHLFFETDYEDYFNWALETIQNHEKFKIESINNWERPVQTFFSKFGEKSFSLVAIKNNI